MISFKFISFEYKFIDLKKTMSSFKTLDLLKVLNKKETASFREKLLLNKRKSLVSLFDLSQEIIKSKIDLNFKDFFELFYKEKYQKSKDNTFRNEMRVLNGLLEQSIVDIKLEKKQKNELYFSKQIFLEKLLEANSFDLFEKEITKIFKQIVDSQDYIVFYDFFDLWAKFKNKSLKVESNFFEETKSFYNDAFHYWEIEIGLKTRKLEIFKAFIDRTSYVVDRNLVFDDAKESIDFKSIKNQNYFIYLTNKVESFKKSGIDKVKLLKENINLLGSIKTSGINKNNEMFILNQYLGVEYLILGENEIASQYFEASLNYSDEIESHNIIKGIYNYLSSLIKIREYAKAVSLYEKYKDIVDSSNVSDMFSCILTMCFIYLNDIPKAESTIKFISSNASVDNYLYSRCNIAIIHYLNDEKELAENELINIFQSLNYHKNQDKTFNEFVSKFKKFLKLSLTKSFTKANQEKIISLKYDLEDTIKKSSIHFGIDSLHTNWLLGVINQEILS